MAVIPGFVIVLLGFIGPMIVAGWLAATSKDEDEFKAWALGIFALVLAFFYFYGKGIFG